MASVATRSNGGAQPRGAKAPSSLDAGSTSPRLWTCTVSASRTMSTRGSTSRAVDWTQRRPRCAGCLSRMFRRFPGLEKARTEIDRPLCRGQEPHGRRPRSSAHWAWPRLWLRADSTSRYRNGARGGLSPTSPARTTHWPRAFPAANPSGDSFTTTPLLSPSIRAVAFLGARCMAPGAPGPVEEAADGA